MDYLECVDGLDSWLSDGRFKKVLTTSLSTWMLLDQDFGFVGSLRRYEEKRGRIEIDRKTSNTVPSVSRGSPRVWRDILGRLLVFVNAQGKITFTVFYRGLLKTIRSSLE